MPGFKRLSSVKLMPPIFAALLISLRIVPGRIVPGTIHLPGDLPKYTTLNQQKYDNHLLELLFKNIMGATANTMKYSELAPEYRAEVIRKHLNVMIEARRI